jgi:5-methylcytosine-specific restriction endonuclease McrA
MPQRTQVDPDLSEQLRLQILRRDRWRCQICGSMRQLEVHHQLFRSHGGQDIERNLMTLCNACHAELHKGPNSSR